MAKSKRIQQGRELLASEKWITINGKRMRMVFNNRTYMLMERLWQAEYGERVNFKTLLEYVGESMLTAIMALYFCALRVGENYSDTEFDDFCDSLTLDDLATIGDAALDGALESLPESDGNERKNA